jgi:D-alanyl-D-alanine carboxypeptidase
MLAGAMLAASLALSPTQLVRIDAVVEQVMHANHIAGLSIGIARKGDVLLVRGYGVRDVNKYVFADGDTIYRIGSITKQFTAALVLQQVESSHLALGALVHGATVEELLAQTSGIPTYSPGTRTLDDALAAQPLFRPGSQWDYSNTNYFLLGTLLESTTRTTYPRLLWNNIVSPLHLRATSFALPHGNDVALGYEYNDGAFIEAQNTSADAPQLSFSAAAMSSNARDLLAWLEDLRTGRVVSAHDFTDMTTTKTLSDGTRTQYGFGFYIRNWYGWQTAEHPGNVDGYSADDAIVLDDGLEIAILSNADGVSLEPLSKSVVAIMEPAKDASSVADFTHPAQNENASVTADIRRTLQALQNGSLDHASITLRIDPSFTPNLGSPSEIEFIDRSTNGGVRFEKYRLSYTYQQYWMTLAYGADGKISGLTVALDED